MIRSEAVDESKLEDWEQLDENVMSTLDNQINSAVAARLRSGNGATKEFARYSAWNFCGYVWWTGTEWGCQIWRYHAPMETLYADTLEEIGAEASGKYGAE